MIAVITGDLIGSQEHKPDEWLPALKETMGLFGKEPEDWEVYRGDSFQIILTPEMTIKAALMIKAAMRQLPGLGVRMAIGLGDEAYHSGKITESNGPAFVKSGECFEALKKTTMAISSDDAISDELFNYMLELALLTMDNWHPATAGVVSAALKYPGLTQKELAAKLGKSQSSVSEALSRAGYDEITRLQDFFISFYLKK
ncbi:transcriptional regulator [Roseivirga sp. BDSF3-8]|uniref:transcriptional regulator n=1 Tax=Roseivirga sp. BDSF3-8 TaxID=3241598 RepID=UPI0035320774